MMSAYGKTPGNLGALGVAVFYPEDDDYLIDRETTVTHYDVARTN